MTIYTPKQWRVILKNIEDELTGHTTCKYLGGTWLPPREGISTNSYIRALFELYWLYTQKYQYHYNEDF